MHKVFVNKQDEKLMKDELHLNKKITLRDLLNLAIDQDKISLADVPKGWVWNNPKKEVRLYSNAIEIKARKGADSLWPDEYFKHDFKESNDVEVYGMPDGTLKLKSAKGKPLWKWFEYDDRDIRKD